MSSSIVSLVETGVYVDHLERAEQFYAQVLGLTGAEELVEGCRALLERGVECVAATCGAEGAVVVDREGEERVPAPAVDVVDTTGCGDAFSAGFLRGLSLGRSRRESGALGCAAAGLVAGGLGSDHGRFDLAQADRLAGQLETTTQRS